VVTYTDEEKSLLYKKLEKHGSIISLKILRDGCHKHPLLRELWVEIYEAPYEDLPLYITDNNFTDGRIPVSNIIVQWRFSIGR